jgi:ferredoxin-type protein NapH
VTSRLSKEKEPKTEVKPATQEKRSRGIRRKLLRFQTLRTIVQLLFFFLFFTLFLGLGPWPILLPVIGLLGVPSKTMGDALGSLQYMLYLTTPPWLAVASIFIASAIVGRAFCAWSCPFGLAQDVLEIMKKRHAQVSLRTHNQMINVKYFVLAATLLVSGVLAISTVAGLGKRYQGALGVFAIAPFNALSPADTLFAVIPRTVLGVGYGIPVLLENPDVAGALVNTLTSVQALFWARIIILALTLTLALYVPRGWCRYLCPQGAFSAIFMRFSFLGLKRDPVRCSRVECHDCVEACPMMVPILDQPWEKFTHPECIMCLKCVDACSSSAIKPKFP